MGPTKGYLNEAFKTQKSLNQWADSTKNKYYALRSNY